MTLIRFEPLREIESLHSRLQRYFDDFPTLGFGSSENYSPRIDIRDEGDHLIVDAEIPGVRKEDLKLTLEDNILTIEGEKKKEEKTDKENYFRTERIFGSFKRCFTLPVEIDSSEVDAKFENGMLLVKLKKLVEKPVEAKTIELH